MLSFPSTLNKGGSGILNPKASSSAKDVLTNSFKSAFNKSVSNMTNDGIDSKLDIDGIKYDIERDNKELINKFDFTNKQYEVPNNTLMQGEKAGGTLSFDKKDKALLDEYKFGYNVMNTINNYRVAFKNIDIDSGIDSPTDDTNKEYIHHVMTVNSMSPSLFNPNYGLNTKGISDNVPLLDNATVNGNNMKYDCNDCSIANLVTLSKSEASPLGLARYKYADFMYCRDVGKISNNRLITLRKFSIPVGDNIFQGATIHTANGRPSNMTMPADIGRMVTWFGTDENKLEDIMSYEYEATFIQKEGKIQQLDSQEDDDARGPMGKMINSMSAAYNRDVGKGIADGGAIKWLVEKFGIHPKGPTYKSDSVALGRNYDNNKVYEPKDTVRDTYLYEGKLIFKHEFALTFNYKLRAYDNINPKAAMLDLLANILTTTYRKGKFWGGQQQILGPQPNYDGWAKANAFVDKAINKTGSFLDDLFNLKGIDFESVAGFISNGLSWMGNVVGATVDSLKGLASGDTEKLKQQKDAFEANMKKLWKNNQFGQVLSGMIKNTLGRPSLYAFDSILSGSNVGPWHVTIGNPLNPIAVFGNLIMTNCKVTHSGPLGLDDFPTDLKVTVSLKHGRGRDMVDISKMYTKGEQAIMLSLNSPKSGSETGDRGKDKEILGQYVFNKYELDNSNLSSSLSFTGSLREWTKNAQELR